MKKQSPKKNFPVIKTVKDQSPTHQRTLTQATSKSKEIPTLPIAPSQKPLVSMEKKSTPSKEKNAIALQQSSRESVDTPRTKAINAIKSKTIMASNNNNSNNSNNDSQLSALNQKITQLKLTLEEMEKERDFYFTKLRDIEILTQQINDSQVIQHSFYKSIMDILYKVEEGFEIPDENIDSAKIILNK